jgi:hypothetical protein
MPRGLYSWRPERPAHMIAIAVIAIAKSQIEV